MGLFSFLFKNKSDVEAAKNAAQSPAPQVGAPIGQPDHAPPPIAPAPADQNPIAAAVEQQAKQDTTNVSLQDPTVSARSPEEMCAIDPSTMDRDAIRAHLAALYRRHNAAAASLDAELRDEAELMLDAIVACREKYIEAS